jgi:pyridoxal phosphate enzyme (YggS family)
MSKADIAANLRRIRERIAQAAARAGRDGAEISLVAVTKTWPAEVIREVVAQGPVILGENKLQEAERKIPQLPAGVCWHFIGHLQRNKARKALELFEAIHSVDSLSLAVRLDLLADELDRRPQIYLQVNGAGEASKSGFSETSVRAELDTLLALPHLKVMGLMSIPPVAESPEAARASFRALRELRDELQERSGVALPGLSMGMSHDFEPAIEEGATIVRIGSAIFGPRHQEIDP